MDRRITVGHRSAHLRVLEEAGIAGTQGSREPSHCARSDVFGAKRGEEWLMTIAECLGSKMSEQQETSTDWK